MNWTIIDNITFESTYHNENLAKTRLNELFIGMNAQHWKIDGVAESVNNMLYQHNGNYGGDLQALDIQRGRDTGLPSYKDYLIKRFNRCIVGYQSFDWIPGAVPAAQKLYGSIDDVDLLFGLMMEFHRSAPMGNSCIDMTVIQMRMVKDGDPKFFTKIMTESQRQAIEQINLNDLVCLLTDTNLTLEDGRFGRADNANPLQECRCKTLASCGFDISLFCKKGYCVK